LYSKINPIRTLDEAFDLIDVALQIIGTLVLVTPSRSESIYLFEGLLNQLKNGQTSKKLGSEINRILERISFDTN